MTNVFILTPFIITMESGEQPLDAIWIFSDEFRSISNKEIWSAHTSQPIGMPLHKHSGKLRMDSSGITLTDSQTAEEISIPREQFSSYAIAFDDLFTRFGYSRGMNPPLHFTVGDRTIYMFCRDENGKYYSGANPALVSFIDPENRDLQKKARRGTQQNYLVYGIISTVSIILIAIGTLVFMHTHDPMLFAINLAVALILPLLVIITPRLRSAQ